MTATLLDINTARSAAYMTDWGNSISNILRPSPNVFYVFENRQQEGWDAYIPGHGMLITKIYYRYNWWKGNSVNNSSSNLGVDIIEADGSAPKYSRVNRDNGYFGKGTDAFPAGANMFTDVAAYKLTNITEANKKITFDVNGGGETTILETINHIKVQKEGNIKWLRNGMLIIQHGNELYDIYGKRIE